MKKPSRKDWTLSLAGPTGFEPAISSVTGRHVRPLHHEPASVVAFAKRTNNRGNHSKILAKKQRLLCRHFLIGSNTNDVNNLVGGRSIDNYFALFLVNK
jgi:hypothetical protein